MPNWKKLITSGSDASLNSLDITETLTVETDTLYVSGSNVGIGTTSPLQKLTINNSADNTTFLLTTVGGNNRLSISTDSSANALIRTGNNVDLRLGVNEDAVVIKNGGNVGIGTTSPQYALQVEGTITGSRMVLPVGTDLWAT